MEDPMNRLTREQAREILRGAAYAEWADALGYAWEIGSQVLAREAYHRLVTTLEAVESWLSAVYDEGLSPREADYQRFLGRGADERLRGLGFLKPSEVLRRAGR
jgi:hypothetical protein